MIIKINSVKEWLLTSAINEFIKRWDQQNKNYVGNKKICLKQYFKLLNDKCIEKFYEKDTVL